MAQFKFDTFVDLTHVNVEIMFKFNSHVQVNFYKS